jgi:hypothetical protein
VRHIQKARLYGGFFVSVVRRGENLQVD